MERQTRSNRKERLNQSGIRPAKKQWLTCVETSAIEIPQWAVEKAFKGIESDVHRVWFRGRGTRAHARQLEFEDRKAGGDPELTQVEWRYCPVCHRIMLALEAGLRRRMDESHKQGREFPCSGECQP